MLCSRPRLRRVGAPHDETINKYVWLLVSSIFLSFFLSSSCCLHFSSHFSVFIQRCTNGALTSPKWATLSIKGPADQTKDLKLDHHSGPWTKNQRTAGADRRTKDQPLNDLKLFRCPIPKSAELYPIQKHVVLALLVPRPSPDPPQIFARQMRIWAGICG